MEQEIVVTRPISNDPVTLKVENVNDAGTKMKAFKDLRHVTLLEEWESDEEEGNKIVMTGCFPVSTKNLEAAKQGSYYGGNFELYQNGMGVIRPIKGFEEDFALRAIGSWDEVYQKLASFLTSTFPI